MYAAPKAPSLIALCFVVSTVYAGEGDRLQRALDWPKVEPAGYERLYIEDARVTDPEAPERKRQQLVESVPERRTVSGSASSS